MKPLESFFYKSKSQNDKIGSENALLTGTYDKVSNGESIYVKSKSQTCQTVEPANMISLIQNKMKDRIVNQFKIKNKSGTSSQESCH
jgi:hypothetical protein